MAVTDAPRGDITLDSETYRIELDSYRVRDITDFAPRAATPGGSIVHSLLGLYQPYMKTDWRHGFGFQWETDNPMGYLRTDGEIDTRHSGIAMRFTDSVDDSDDFVAQGFVAIRDFDAGDAGNDTDYTFAFGPSLRKRTIAGVWSDEPSSSTGSSYGTINDILQTSNYVHIALDGGNVVRILKSTGVADAAGSGNGASSDDFKWLLMHEGYIYGGIDNTFTGLLELPTVGAGLEFAGVALVNGDKIEFTFTLDPA